MAFTTQLDYKFRSINSLREENRKLNAYENDSHDYKQAMKKFFESNKIEDVFQKLRESEPQLQQVMKRADEVKIEVRKEICKTQRFLRTLD